MRIVINGKSYKLRDNIAIRLRGIALAIVAVFCFIADVDTAGIFFAGLAALMLFPYGCLYRIAEKIVESERRM
jgi:hypothetical protein